jgi:hypothetical protein
VAGTSTVELRNLSSEVEGELRTNYGDEADVEGDDEREDNDGNVREEAPNDPDIRIRQPLGVDSNTPVDRAVSIQLLRQMNSSNMACKSNPSLFRCSL